MPIYEYRCDSCGASHEALQKMSDLPLTDCPVCGEPQLVKLVSAAAFHLKGGGWYQTDFKTAKQPEAAAPAAETGAAQPDAKAEPKPKADAKPAAKPAASTKTDAA